MTDQKPSWVDEKATYQASRWRKKPVEIDAFAWDGSRVTASACIDWMLEHGGTARYAGKREREDFPDVATLAIETLEGTMTALPGDFIIKGVQGEFYPCKSDIFDATYEKVASNDPLSEVRDGEAP